MDLLPDQLVVLDLDLNGSPNGAWTRVEAAEQRLWTEKDWDAVLLANCDAVAGALRNAGLIGSGSTLRSLGSQFERVDVLYAEVDAHTQVFRRFVLVEDKLAWNPDAKRAVVAQVVEYGLNARTWALERLAGKWPGQRTWLIEHEDRIQESLGRGDLLLVIAGNGIDDELQRLAQYLVGQRFAHDPTDLALLCLTVFRNDQQLLFVPHVVSAFTKSVREHTIRVVVETENGDRVPARILPVESRPREKGSSAAAGEIAQVRSTADVAVFLRAIKQQLDAEFQDWNGTEKPTRILSWHLSPDALGRVTVWLGLGFNERKRLIQVGFDGDVGVLGLKDSWRATLDALRRDGRLPKGAAIAVRSPNTISANVAVPWPVGSDLDADLEARVVSILRQLHPVIDELVGMTPPPEARLFLGKVSQVLDAEMVAAGWTPEPLAGKAVQYYAENADGAEWAYQMVSFGADDPADCFTIRAGMLATASTSTMRDQWLSSVRLIQSQGHIPSEVVVECPAENDIGVLKDFRWKDPDDLGDALLESVVAAFRAIRDALVATIGIKQT